MTYSLYKTLYMVFVDMENALDGVPRYVVWWALLRIGFEEWLVQLIQSMYDDARSRVRVGLQPEWRVKCESGCSPRLLPEPSTVHHGSWIPLPRFSHRMPMRKPVDELVIITELLEELILWKINREGKGLRVNMGKTKVLISGLGLDVLQNSRKDPFGVCFKGIGTNCIFCGDCSSLCPCPPEAWSQLQV